MMDVELQLINQSLVVTAGLPQLIITAVLYLMLALAAVVVSRRTPAVPFTLAGILMLRSELANVWVDVTDEEDSPVTEKSKE
ncbi:hypothetical protein FIBSPDRAFT_876554 [Athelia psychrophila]|uniref:Uncharacterized protein n=1 Tax=Athelia psychrophila TaxID=1759441 RepID=A0A167WSK9_9AGAM|nr:hypothetical protein FIBSPDRAFT_876554 [Fibularhizoctonia sp. CBS 109695]